MIYRREIDGLRALAVLPVIFFHAGFQVFSGGYVGVDIFFVISGYLITNIIFEELSTGKFKILNFYERRARRLLPALFIVLISCLPFAWIFLTPADMKDFSASLLAVSTFSSNVFFWKTSGYFESSAELKPLLHTWSLAVEEQYYVVLPILLILFWKLGISRIKLVLIFFVLVSISLAYWGSLNKPTPTFYLLPTRAWELLIGAILALQISNFESKNVCEQIKPMHKQLLSLLGLILISYAFFFFDKNTPVPSFYTLVPTLGAALIIFSADKNTLVGQFLGSRILVGIGLISYSVYLWHQPLLAFAKHSSLNEPSQYFLSILVAGSLILGYLTWRFVELPFRNKSRFNQNQMFLCAFLASTIFVLIGLVGYFTNGYIFRKYGQVIDLAAQAADEKNTNNSCQELLSIDKNFKNACKIGVKKSTPDFVIVGDSHAAAFVDGLGRSAQKVDLSGLDYTYSSCIPLKYGQATKQTSLQITCNALRAEFYKKLSAGELPKTIILIARWTLWMEKIRFNNTEGGIESGEEAIWHRADTPKLSYEEALKLSYVESVEAMLKAGHKVILVYPVPEMGWDVPNRLSKIYLARNTISYDDGSTLHKVFQARNKHTYEALDAINQNDRLIRIKPEEVLCSTYIKNRCAAQIDGVPLYFDDDHLSNAGINLIIQKLMNQLTK